MLGDVSTCDAFKLFGEKQLPRYFINNAVKSRAVLGERLLVILLCHYCSCVLCGLCIAWMEYKQE